MKPIGLVTTPVRFLRSVTDFLEGEILILVRRGRQAVIGRREDGGLGLHFAAALFARDGDRFALFVIEAFVGWCEEPK